MATYIIAGLLTILVILAVRSYFGKKYRGGCNGCSGCPHAKNCTSIKNKMLTKSLVGYMLILEFCKILMYAIQNSWVSLMPQQRCFACGLFYGR